nr:uncharacterized protein LOC104097958 [Nicotiana tomentosiformis]
MLKDGQLRELLSDRAKTAMDGAGAKRKPQNQERRQTINMIFGGDEINGITFSSAKKTKISTTYSKRLREDDITFTDEDTDVLLLSHNDTLVISLNVLNFKIKLVLLDPGSSANIIQQRVLDQTKLTVSIIPTTKLLVGFNLASVTTRAVILLLVEAEGVTKTALFVIVDGDMG